jgi:hypothetical protein
MYGRARSLVLVAAVIMMPSLADAQVSLQPTPRPVVTAENEGWYVAGEPIVFAGSFYYPAGAQIYFNGDEMVRSGFYLGIPLYVRTTEEPYSRVYVPLAGGLLQPYERRRAGEIAGTVGSTAPGYPVVLPSEQSSEAAVGTSGIAQAPAPPTMAPYANLPATAARANVYLPALPTGNAATVAPAADVPETSSRRGSRTALRPKGLNGVYVEFDHARWFSSGPAVPLDSARFSRIGDYRGFNVYRDRTASAGTIYIQLAQNVTSFVTPYSRRAAGSRQ